VIWQAESTPIGLYAIYPSVQLAIALECGTNAARLWFLASLLLLRSMDYMGENFLMYQTTPNLISVVFYK